MNIDLVIMLIFVVCLCIIVFQCIEFIQNYDYIKKFNDQYSKYEYVYTPSYNYTDSTVIDPNDTETNVNLKWRCFKSSDYYYGVSEKGMILKDNDYGQWLSYNDCLDFIFSKYVLNYKNPCDKNNSNKYCLIFKTIKWN